MHVEWAGRRLASAAADHYIVAPQRMAGTDKALAQTDSRAVAVVTSLQLEEKSQSVRCPEIVAARNFAAALLARARNLAENYPSEQASSHIAALAVAAAVVVGDGLEALGVHAHSGLPARAARNGSTAGKHVVTSLKKTRQKQQGKEVSTAYL